MRLFAFCIAAVLACVAPALAASFALPDRAAIEAAVAHGDSPLNAAGSLDRSFVASIYQNRNYQPIWTEERTRSFQRALDAAASHGIDPAEFRVDTSRPLDRELAQTDAFLRYAAALARGRVDPETIESDWDIGVPVFDPKKTLDAALAGDVATMLNELAPHDPAYARLRTALQQYRALAKTGWQPFRATKTLRPGDRSEAIRALHERLAAEGFIAPTAANDALSSYDGAIVAAVSRFQATHGLADDGVIGPATRVALDISAAARVEEIELNLERWRSLPRITAATRIEVNAAAATAVLYENGQTLKTTRVIVGKARNPTPLLRAQMQSVLFNPPWYVPNSIYTKEIRPAMNRDPSYLERGNYVFRNINGYSQLVQLPGPKNALGLLKFEMPNSDDVYMHDTPNRRLFQQANRALSHGCVRVDDPRDLARLVLDSPQWSPEAIDAAIASGDTQRVPLPHVIPVYFLYWTAFVDPDGTVEFRDDLYGRDRRLAAALAAHATTSRLAESERDGSKCG